MMLPVRTKRGFEQHRIVAELEALPAAVAARKRLQAGTGVELGALLNRAFKGELQIRF